MHISYCGYDWRHDARFVLNRSQGLSEWVIVQVTSPKWWWMSDEQLTLGAGWCMVLPPHVPHCYGTRGRPFSNHWIHVDGLADPGLPLSEPFSVADPAEVSLAFRDLHREWTARASGWEDACAAYTTLVLIAMRRGCERARRPRAADDGPLRDLRARLRSAPGRAWTVPTMAAAVKLSPSRFRARYRAAFGISPLEDLLAVRLEQARALITDGLTVAVAAERSGFRDLSYFHRQYRRRLGATPAAGRRGT